MNRWDRRKYFRRAGKSRLGCGRDGRALEPPHSRDGGSPVEIAIAVEDRPPLPADESEQRYQRLLAALTDCVYSVTIVRGRPVAAARGPGCEAVTGCTPGDYEADPSLWHRMIYGPDRQAVMAQAEQVVRGETPAPLEHRICHKDGRLRWIRNTPVPRRDASGQIIGYDGVVSDITERKNEEEQRRLAEARFQAILDHTPAVIHLKDAEGRYILTNRRFQQLFHASGEELVGKSSSDFFPQEAAAVLQNHDRQVRTTLVPLEFEETVAQADGLHTYLSIKFPLFDAEGKYYASGGIATDITERKRAEQELRRAYDKLSQNQATLQATLKRLRTANEQLLSTQLQLIQAAKLESIGTLAAGVAHEVKNPLQTILMGLEYLTNNLASGNLNAPLVLDEMRDAVTRANTIVRELLQLSAAKDFNPGVEDVNPLVERALQLVHNEVLGSHTSVITQLDPGLPPARLDRSKIEQVLINLFLNALQAMPQRGTLTVTTGHGCFGDHSKVVAPTCSHFRLHDPVVLIEVQDTGQGIPEENLKRIFDPFFTTKPAGVGTGLGLPVVKQIMDLHHGAVQLRNVPTGGVAVTLLLRAERENEI